MNELTKPTLKVDLDIKLPEIKPVEHNLAIIENYTNDLISFYEKLIFTADQYTEAKEERTKVNKLLKAIADNRKETIKKYKEPIDDFEATSKRIEKQLERAASIIGSSIERFDYEEQEKKRVVINNVIDAIRKDFILKYEEYTKALGNFEIEFDKRWFNKTYKDADLFKDIEAQFNAKVDDLDSIKKDAQLIIDFYNNIDKDGVLNKEVYVERYMNTRDVNRVIEDIKNDYESKKTVSGKTGTGINEVADLEVDPFAGLTVNNIRCYFQVICDPTQKDLLIKFALNNGMEIKEEK